MATMTVDVALEAGDLLGEGPVWCAEEQSLYWVDIKKPVGAQLEAGHR